MFKWILGYIETLYLMKTKANRHHLREAMAQADRGETTGFSAARGNVGKYLFMMTGTEIDLEFQSAYVRVHDCKFDKTIEYEHLTYVDLCVDGQAIGVEILNFKSVLSAPLSAGSDVEVWHSNIDEAVLAARSFVLQDLMKSGLYDHRPIHKS
jgi:uncharacterized protein YuzE